MHYAFYITASCVYLMTHLLMDFRQGLFTNNTACNSRLISGDEYAKLVLMQERDCF